MGRSCVCRRPTYRKLLNGFRRNWVLDVCVSPQGWCHNPEDSIPQYLENSMMKLILDYLKIFGYHVKHRISLAGERLLASLEEARWRSWYENVFQVRDRLFVYVGGCRQPSSGGRRYLNHEQVAGSKAISLPHWPGCQQRRPTVTAFLKLSVADSVVGK